MPIPLDYQRPQPQRELAPRYRASAVWLASAACFSLFFAWSAAFLLHFSDPFWNMLLRPSSMLFALMAAVCALCGMGATEKAWKAGSPRALLVTLDILNVFVLFATATAILMPRLAP